MADADNSRVKEYVPSDSYFYVAKSRIRLPRLLKSLNLENEGTTLPAFAFLTNAEAAEEERVKAEIVLHSIRMADVANAALTSTEKTRERRVEEARVRAGVGNPNTVGALGVGGQFHSMAIAIQDTGKAEYQVHNVKTFIFLVNIQKGDSIEERIGNASKVIGNFTSQRISLADARRNLEIHFARSNNRPDLLKLAPFGFRTIVVRKRGRPRMHPQGISTVLVTLQDKNVVPGPNSNYINILMANSRIRSLSSITYGTLENYKVGWRAYVSFCCDIFTDKFKEWKDSDRDREGAMYQVVVITGFAEHIMLGGKQSGHVVCKYMTAVRFMLIHCGVNIDFMQNPMVRGTRVAMEKFARKREVDEGKGDKRWPATTTFVTELSTELASWQSHGGHALMVDAWMAFCFLLRCSEYLITSANQEREEEDDGDPVHTIRADDVWLEFEETLDPARGRQMVLVRPMDAHKQKLQDLIAVDFQIPSSKTDQAGLGIPFYSPRLRVGKRWRST